MYEISWVTFIFVCYEEVDLLWAQGFSLNWVVWAHPHAKPCRSETSQAAAVLSCWFYISIRTASFEGSALPFVSFGPLFSLSKTCSAWLRAHDPWGMMGLRAYPHLLSVPTPSMPQEPLDCDMAAPVSSKPFKPQWENSKHPQDWMSVK